MIIWYNIKYISFNNYWFKILNEILFLIIIKLYYIYAVRYAQRVQDVVLRTRYIAIKKKSHFKHSLLATYIDIIHYDIA